ncbi:hypothetical protein SLS55_010681 [Diplodia seriata]|uniref:Xylanolytic transcriptional activator regulatory domain-containing protein n=1 Tax=Diplodia seriata TaxID=420778 RepID=A0ABR3BX98_9PEZI
MLLGQSMLLRPFLERAFATSGTFVGTPEEINDGSAISSQSQHLKRKLIATAAASRSSSAHQLDPDVPVDRPAKRPRVDGSSESLLPASAPLLPPPEVLRSLFELYASRIHPWIPVLHVRSFREEMADPSKQPRLVTIFHAIVSVCARFSPDAYFKGRTDLKDLSTRCRHTVILQSMETATVQNLQALVIVAFDIVSEVLFLIRASPLLTLINQIGGGRGPMAWSLVNSLTRSVEQLQLSVEEEDDNASRENTEYLFHRMSFLGNVNTWIESEERRRIFWNAFLMDRFCSIGTGWNNSLTRNDVRRRLPCEGRIWEAGTPTTTPYFGIGENMSPSQQQPTPTSERVSANENEVESIGGFAFCIEATESLNLVTKFFLQHGINFKSSQGIQVWLMRFKELDLRLVRWRLFLPPKWRTACALNEDGNMDPNLTLAHITHNAAVIQLHQAIAYPVKQWHHYSATLPSSTSAGTCLTAAKEIVMIAKEFLRASDGITNPQFSFCLFIAGRVLLAHSVHYTQLVSADVSHALSLLREISTRWSGEHYTGIIDTQGNLASRFADRLEKAHASLQAGSHDVSNPVLDIREPAYSEQAEAQQEDDYPKESASRSAVPSAGQIPQNATAGKTPQTQNNGDLPGVPAQPADNDQSPDSISLAFPPLPLSFQQGGFDGGQFDPLSAMDNPHAFASPTAQSSYAAFEDFRSIFDDSFQQELRVSTYSNLQDLSSQGPLN